MRASLPPADPHAELYRNVRGALMSLSDRFRSDISVSGLLATDIFTLNQPFGAAIEDQTVAALNDMRDVWDPDSKYQAYSFVRQPQTFPDVRLQRRRDDGTFDILLGIELKGWYLFAKEAEPSFRFSVSPRACTPRDLLVVFPWALNHVISGKARLFDPFVESAAYAAEYRNWHWETGGDGTRRVTPATNPVPYPVKSDEVSDGPDRQDSNFGRIARTGLMDAFKAECDAHLLAGIRVEHWREFFSAFTQSAEDQAITEQLEELSRQIEQEMAAPEGAQRWSDCEFFSNTSSRLYRKRKSRQRNGEGRRPSIPSLAGR